MRVVKKAIFYVGAIFLMGWLMSLNQAICNLVGAVMLIFIMRMAIPILALNYKLRNANKKIEISVIPSKSRLRNKMWFAAWSSGLILISFNDQVFVPLATVIYIGLGALYMPIIIRGHVWEEEVIEVKETNLWRA
ncbi:hypothetical protein [Paenibacillus agricola]|uniref:SdpI/YhfL family protein n=1 Tax=Paenibacillus agricola TaxID=2716264 RepID=A0ABX0JAW0_9BACL|nr:hypothetical protein [Paenibacillus agricola]NHN33272.1 hypothetical protein [Paenibacillus agricola]